MKQINLINLNIYENFLTDIDNEIICSQINQYGLPASSSEEFLNGNNHTYFEDTIIPISKEISKLEDLIINSVESLTSKSYEIYSIWALKLSYGQSVMMHSHKSKFHLTPEEYFSVAYYPMAGEDSAKLIFSTSHCNTIDNVVSVKAETGKLIIFNSYINHMTSRNFSKEPRIVVSANLQPLDPSLKENQDWSVYSNRPVID